MSYSEALKKSNDKTDNDMNNNKKEEITNEIKQLKLWSEETDEFENNNNNNNNNITELENQLKNILQEYVQCLINRQELKTSSSQILDVISTCVNNTLSSHFSQNNNNSYDKNCIEQQYFIQQKKVIIRGNKDNYGYIVGLGGIKLKEIKQNYNNNIYIRVPSVTENNRDIIIKGDNCLDVAYDITNLIDKYCKSK